MKRSLKQKSDGLLHAQDFVAAIVKQYNECLKWTHGQLDQMNDDQRRALNMYHNGSHEINTMMRHIHDKNKRTIRIQDIINWIDDSRASTSQLDIDKDTLFQLSISSLPRLYDMYSASIRERIIALDSIFDEGVARTTQRDVVVYRGVGDELKHRKSGEIITEHAFMSTSLNPYVSRMYMRDGGTLMSIVVPKGTPFTMMEKEYGLVELEMLFPRGARLCVDEVTSIYDIRIESYTADRMTTTPKTIPLLMVTLVGFDKVDVPNTLPLSSKIEIDMNVIRSNQEIACMKSLDQKR